jgi:murein DD-endopeptidase MepM/ murein hydrolase activator NlpD
MRTTHTTGVAATRRPRRSRLRLAAILSVIGVLATGSLVVTGATAAYATSYPSWNDVIQARANAAAKAKEVTDITAAIAALDAQVESTQADAVAKGDAYNTADAAYSQAALKQQSLQKQAAAAEKMRKQSEAQAGQVAAQLARSGTTGGLGLNLLLNGGDASNLLDSIGNAGKVSERANDIYKKAVQDQKSAQSLTDQASVAANILKGLKATAQTALAAAQQAATAAADALDAQQTHKAELQAQLAALNSTSTTVEADYLKGVQAVNGAGASLGAGEVTASGWAKPAIGRITSGFGYRSDPAAGGAWRLHDGTDLAAGCNIPIYAAHTGKVVYAGPNGTLGNYILIDDGDGIETGYGHIINGGILVSIGQSVGVGQNIARTGETGAATGCHLHFEVHKGGVPIDAVPFMRDQGITLG